MNITKSAVISSLRDMKNFHDQLQGLYTANGMDLTQDVGRRNILMSLPMEHNLTKELKFVNEKVVNDGRTGKADIIITNGEIEEELECKLTSPHKSGAISLQSDFDTLERKGSLDYMYYIADRKFEKFVVIHFKGLTVDDFRSVAPGSRGKVQMKYSKAMSKAEVLVGKVNNSNHEKRRKIFEKIILLRRKANVRLLELQQRFEACSENANAQRNKITKMIENCITSTESRAFKLMKEFEDVAKKTPRFSFEFADIQQPIVEEL